LQEVIKRIHETLIAQRLGQFPAVGIVGPRQAGKTTLAKELASGYFDLEQDSDRIRLDLQWRELTEKDELIILDEAQTWPEIFPRLRGAIDSRRSINGRFLLLGSVSPSLMKQVSESLAGRIAFVDLNPLSGAELPAGYLDQLWKKGGFPDGGALRPDSPIFPVWQESYLRQISHQDLPAWGLPSKPRQTDRLLRMLAAINGNQLNFSKLGQNLGVSYHTVQTQIDFLEGAYLVRKLVPFFRNNFPKRLTKAPKIYFRDSGLLHFLLGLSQSATLTDQPWVGQSWESFVAEQIISTRRATGEIFQEYYFRTNDGLECDLLLDTEIGMELIEIKLSSNPSSVTFSKLAKIADLVGAKRQVVISRIPDDQVIMSDEIWSMNLPTYLAQFTDDFRATNPQNPGIKNSSPDFFRILKDAAAGLVREGVLSSENVTRRASLLSKDMQRITPEGTRILPPRWITPPGSDLLFLIAEYQFDHSGHSLEKVSDPFNPGKRVENMEGSGLDRESLLYLGKVCEIGNDLIPSLWALDEDLLSNLRNPKQHLDTLNEIWWLSRWQGIDHGSITHSLENEAVASSKKAPAPNVDWSFTALGGQVRINLEVKRRTGTKGVQSYDKQIYSSHLFDGNESKKFRVSSPAEINVLAITAFHGGWITEDEEAAIVLSHLTSLKYPVIDAIALFVIGSQGSYEKLYFPPDRELAKRDLILRAIFKPIDPEDHSYVGVMAFPQDLGKLIEQAKGGK